MTSPHYRICPKAISFPRGSLGVRLALALGSLGLTELRIIYTNAFLGLLGFPLQRVLEPFICQNKMETANKAEYCTIAPISPKLSQTCPYPL